MYNRKIIIMRHANAKPSTPPPGLTDKDRPLSKKGWEELENLEEFSIKCLSEVTLVLCSSAVRTRQTLEGVMAYLPKVQHIHYLDELYEAPVWIYLEEINLWRANHLAILIVGHNPAVSEFLANVQELNREGPSKFDADMGGSVPTSGICVYEVREGDKEALGYGDLGIVRES